MVQYAINASLTVPLYSLMYMEVDDVRPAASVADQGTEEANQRYFAARFAGVASQARVSTDAAETKFGVYREFTGDFNCVSGTFEVGDLVTVDEDAGGTFLTNDRLVKTVDPSLAIGEVIERVASAATTVRVRLGARAGSVAGSPITASLVASGGFMGNGLTNTETLSGNKTIATGDPTMHVIDPAGARDLTLPDVAANAGRHFIIRNAADAAEVITIKNAAAATICTPTQNETAIVWSNGTTWFGITGLHN
jgi:hypothetical protein